MRSTLSVRALGFLIGVGCTATVWPQGEHSLSGPYTDPSHLTAIPFGAHSQWAQPWRAYLETVPAHRLLDGLGVGFTAPDGASDELIAEMLARHGIRHTRIEIGWGNLTWEDTIPDHVREAVGRRLRACASRGIRPLVLLNAHHGAPCPARFFERVLAAPAKQGDTTVRLDSTADLVPGRSGLCNLTDYWACEAFVTGTAGDSVSLSKPLPKDLGDAGARVPMATLKYRPFSAPDAPDYAETMEGWRKYVAAVARFAADALGTVGQADRGFDLEIWNELSFGSNYLLINAYYEPDLVAYRGEDIFGGLVRETAGYVDAHPADFAGVRLCDGLSNTIPWPASSLEPARVTALSKHPYAGRRTYPKDKQRDDTYNAVFEHENPPLFYPEYSVCFPEYFATYLQTESVCRDMAPITTDIYGTLHGRNARATDGEVRPVDVWFTEVGFAPSENGVEDRERALHLKAKTTARYCCFYLNKGLERLYLYAACEGDLWLGVVSDAFVDYAKGHTDYPTDDGPYTSPALRTVANLARVMGDGVDPDLIETRPIGVASISDTHGRIVFEGDGTPQHPSLYHRDVLAILPYQVNAQRFVIAYYVQTRDVLEDLPPEEFTVSLTGLRGEGAAIRAYDPIADASMPVSVLDSDAQSLTLRLTATDYPYLLVVDEAA